MNKEIRLENNTIVKDNISGIEYKIVDYIKTDNAYGYGVYFYQFEGQYYNYNKKKPGLLFKGFGLYRNEFTVISKQENNNYTVGLKYNDHYPIYSLEPDGEIIAECLNLEDATRIISALNIYENIIKREKEG